MSDLTEKLIPALQAGDMTAFPAVYEQMATRARGMMQAILAGKNPAQRMDESDLLNSVWMRIAADPAAVLANLTTPDELAGRLHRLLLQRWIQKCGRQTAQKRGIPPHPPRGTTACERVARRRVLAPSCSRRSRIGLMDRNASGDRDEAAELLCQAHAAAERMGLPEAPQTRDIQR